MRWFPEPFFFAFGCKLESFPLGLLSRANATSKSTHKSHNDSFEKALLDNLLFLIFCIWPFYLFALHSLLLSWTLRKIPRNPKITKTWSITSLSKLTSLESVVTYMNPVTFIPMPIPALPMCWHPWWRFPCIQHSRRFQGLTGMSTGMWAGASCHCLCHFLLIFRSRPLPYPIVYLLVIQRGRQGHRPLKTMTLLH
jgi:hypothetical protein